MRIGSVPYLNARPLVAGLADDPDVAYREEVPSKLAALLRDGALDAALVSSIEAAGVDAGRVVPDACIASDGPVLSVKLVGRADPRAARTVALDGASLTAATLTRILYGEFLARPDVTFLPAPAAPDPAATGADATLVIGDAALRLRDPAWCELDLGAAWSDATGLPFVWAVWLLRADAAPLAPAIARRLWRARREGANRAREHAHAAGGGIEPSLAERYLAEVMRYDLGAREREGLARFHALAERWRAR